VPVHDLVIHPRDKELVVGTHGRSVFVADVSHLQQLTSDVLAKDLFVFNPENKSYRNGWGNKRWSEWSGFSEPGTEFVVYAKSSGKAAVKIMSPEGKVLKEMEQEVTQGLNYITYDLTFNESVLEAYQKELSKEKEQKIKKSDNGNYYLLSGKYKVEVKMGSSTIEKNFEIKAPRERPKRKPMKKTP
jgi:hypothetical protein